MRVVELVRADVAVIGAGPAGIAAAARAAEAGARVVVLDESPHAGGQIWRHRAGYAPPAAARRWLARLERSGAQLLAGTSVVDARPGGDGVLLGTERGGAAGRVSAGALVLATGARERFLPFPGWTLPGVIGVGGAQALLKAGTSFAGKRVVLSGSGPLLLPVAAALAADGARVALVAEQAPLARVGAFAAGLWRRPSALVEAARYRARFLRTPYRTGTWVSEARGEGAVREVLVTDGRATDAIACDVLCTGFGLVPNTELPRALGCAVRGGVVAVDADQATDVPRVWCAGEPTGIGGVDLALAEGEIAGLAAVGRGDEARGLHARRDRLRALAEAMERAFAPRDELRALARPDTVVCRCEDVPLGAIARGWTPRQAKLYTRAGMGPCQGRVCGSALAFLHGWPADAVRPPSEPALVSTLVATAADDAQG
jgi:NADPH-dependent 2,4-dienoyl-CoA reductase/sulfur reductase-like enzyme